MPSLSFTNKEIDVLFAIIKLVPISWDDDKDNLSAIKSIYDKLKDEIESGNIIPDLTPTQGVQGGVMYDRYLNKQ
jgi:hypothetical protein